MANILYTDGLFEIERKLLRLFHVSEEADIKIFKPRLPTRKDMNPDVGLVWALCERTLPNFMTPRNCPRVTYHVGKNTSKEDIEKYLPKGYSHAVIIEKDWLDLLKSITLYLYEFNSDDFYQQDEIAGYYVSEKIQKPVSQVVIKNLESELENRNVALITVDNLWNICEKIKKSSFNWSMCRLSNAKEKGKI
ncbi:MAG: hypothetical protein VB118_00985 [Oscillospiraceae bacterium]|nr:hypothetical protein [Oscillospiraceae bacterium]